jgi:hypothetical protein
MPTYGMGMGKVEIYDLQSPAKAVGVLHEEANEVRLDLKVCKHRYEIP